MPSLKEKLVRLLCEAKSKSTEIFNFEKELTYRESLEVEADHLIAGGVVVQEWIPVSERLPEKDGIYLTCNKKKQYEFHMFQTGKRMWQGIWEEDGVTHWMPLPEPPEEVGE